MRKKYIILLIILFQSIVYCNSNKLINLGLHSMKKDESAIGAEIMGGFDYVLNNDNFNTYVMYFKVYENPENSYGVEYIKNYDNKDEVLKFFLSKKIEEYYSREYIPLKNGEKFLYGKLVWDNLKFKNSTKLELYYINKDDIEIKKVYFFDQIIPSSLYDKFDYFEEEGYYPISTINEEFTIFTENKIIHKKSPYLLSYEKKFVEKIFELFKDKIPKEYFEYREKGKFVTQFEKEQDKNNEKRKKLETKIENIQIN